MLPPQGLVVPNSAVYRLDKSLYGLKQASRQWNLRLTVLSGDNLVEIETIKKALDAEFSVKDLEKLKFFLCIEVARSFQDNGTRLEDLTCFQRLLERLLYLTNTRRDIVFAVGKLSQLFYCATDEHYKAAVHILRYIKQALAKGLFFSCQNVIRLFGFVDSNWTTCADSRKSVSDYWFFLESSHFLEE
ncbi:uncharacterized protein LOC107646879 [Arachis ipaensis]|uniref:uncharacterized protein LOC107646879 n=1 Tax=Arachis ipaensis TaxID=130454 RepID=UPI0007AF06A6|nr:uncharacterized protein LOC107646879 [Arachis ipaensis]